MVWVERVLWLFALVWLAGAVYNLASGNVGPGLAGVLLFLIAGGIALGLGVRRGAIGR